MNLPSHSVYSGRPQSTVAPIRTAHPARPLSTHTPSRPTRQPTWNTPAPPYTPPSQPPPSPRPTSPRSNVTRPPAPPSFPVPQPAPAPSTPSPTQISPNNPPVEVHFPTPTAASSPQTQPISLMDRMREVQTLMLERHRLESDTSGANNRPRIQELQQRVTDLSDVEGSGTQAAVNARNSNQPPPYSLDGREGS